MNKLRMIDERVAVALHVVNGVIAVQFKLIHGILEMPIYKRGHHREGVPARVQRLSHDQIRFALLALVAKVHVHDNAR